MSRKWCSNVASFGESIDPEEATYSEIQVEDRLRESVGGLGNTSINAQKIDGGEKMETEKK